MSAKIEAGKGWMIEKQGDFFVKKSEILLPGGLIIPSPSHINGHLKHAIKLYNFWNKIEVWSHPAHSVVKGHLPGELVVEGQVLHHSLSSIYGVRKFSLIGVGAVISFGDIGSDNYLKVKNLVDLSGELF